jgi:hypothetical protein
MRLQIAEYALHYREPLTWTWITYNPDGDTGKGTSKGLDSLTAITRVSRQLHAETTGLVWKSNTFQFDDWEFGAVYRNHPAETSPTENIEDAYNFFYRLTPETTRKLIKKIRLQLEIDGYWPEGYSLTSAVTAIASCSYAIPSAQFTVEDATWYVAARSGNSQHGVDSAFNNFKAWGYQIQSVLSNLEFGPVNNVRIMPTFHEEELRSIDTSLKGADLELVREWAKYGVGAVNNRSFCGRE